MLKPGAAVPENPGRRDRDWQPQHQLGAQGALDLQDSPQRHHLAQLIADVQILNIIRLQAKRRIGLDVHLKDLVEFVKEIDKGRAQKGLQGFKNIAQRDLQRLGLGPVNVQGRAGGSGR